MFKKKEKTQVVETQAQQPQVKQENPKRKKRRSRHIFRLVILVSVCALGWATYDNLKQNVAKTNIKAKTFDIQPAKNIPVNPAMVDTSEISEKSILFKTEKALEQTEKIEEKNTQPVVITEPEPTEVIVEEIEIAEDTSSQEPINKDPEDRTAVLEEEIETTLSDTPTPTYSLKDALIFRDHFLSEKPCGDDFRKLILSDNKHDVVQEVIKATSYFCLTTNNVYGELNNIFKKTKQNALIKYYYMQDSEWVAKIKSLAVRIVQIRDLNPVSDNIPAMLDRAQNTLEQKNIAQTVELIASLPDYLQPEFDTFLEKAKNYADAAAALENLILSYAKGE